jgi:hypothetical protein
VWRFWVHQQEDKTGYKDDQWEKIITTDAMKYEDSWVDPSEGWAYRIIQGNDHVFQQVE